MQSSVDAPQAVLEGTCVPRFEKLREVLRSIMASGGEQGACLAVRLGDEPVVDLWAGSADSRTKSPWQSDTLVNLYSTGKGAAALCVHQLADRGQLDLDGPIADYWPEFGAAGKADVTMRHVLGHRAGLCALDTALPPGAMYDHPAVARAIAAQAPLWTPGADHGYHAVTFGFLLGEVVKRISGRSLGTYLRQEVTGPLGADLHIGLPESEGARVARFTAPLKLDRPDDEPDLSRAMREEPESLTARAFTNPAPLPGRVNSREYRAAEIPSSNAHGNARALANLYGVLANGGSRDGLQLVSAVAIERMRELQSDGVDRVLRVPVRWGMGFLLAHTRPGGHFSPNPRAFGHPGLGGSIGFADPEARLSFGYAMNRMSGSVVLSHSVRKLTAATYACL